MRRPTACFLFPWALAVAFVLLFFWKLAFTNLILARGDAFLYFYPYWAYRAHALLAGQLPLWDPFLFMGAPFLANSQAGVLYPPNWPLALFSAPVALKISIVLHLALGALGACLFARRALGQSPPGALLSALLFALSGYLTSQIEHINQLQGLAWFPWLLLVTHSYLSLPAWRRPLGAYALRLALGALILALQLLAGHTQSAFISLAGAALYGLFVKSPSSEVQSPGADVQSQRGRPRLVRALRFLIRPSFFLLCVLLLAGCLAAAQLLPTLELSQQSLRGGGLPLRETLSFSLNPRLVSRALLPGYSRVVFSEFTAYLGVVGLALAALGVGKHRQRLALLVLAGVGLAFALGAYDPVYVLLANFPPLNLFRVPARWLFLFAFGGAMLAGYGLDRMADSRFSIFDFGWGPWDVRFGRWKLRVGPFPFFLFPFAFVLLLVLLTPLANTLTPPGETGPLGAPALRDVLGWLLPLALLAGLLLVRWPARVRTLGVMALALSELFLAAQGLPYNHLTTPEAYSSIRPAMTELLAARPAPGPAARFLSMSALVFDPGDLAELHSELDPQLPAAAVYDAIIATKNKEVLSPNLPLGWNIPAVDGYDGGILPLSHYAAFTQLFTGAPSADGRLRENLTAVPDNRLLSLVNAGYLTTDKVGDAWVDNVFYDLQFAITLTAGETSAIAYVPKFECTAIGVVTASPAPAEAASAGHILVTFSDGSAADLPLMSNRVRFDRPATPVLITLFGPVSVRGLSLIDERTNAFQSLTLGPYRLAHSGDVKIYANLNVLPRAFVARAAATAPAAGAARARLADRSFDLFGTVILPSSSSISPSLDLTSMASMAPTLGAAITLYEPERVRVTAQGPGYLVLTDAWYPGWLATLDGAPAPIYRADIMFRAVFVPAGTHVVEFRFEPPSVKWGLWLSGLSCAGMLAVLLFSLAARRWRNKKAGA